MIGTNSMTINLATMMEALQHYFDTVIFVEGKSPTIKNVKGNTSDHVPTFVIDFETPKKEGNL